MGTTPRDNRWLPVSLAAIGFLFSAYLEYLHVRAWLDPGATSFCSVAKATDCTAVALSNWSTIGNVPLPIWGAAGFWVLGAASQRRSAWLLPFAAFGAVASLALLVVEVIAIGSICLFCEGVHLIAWVLLFVAWRRRTVFTAPKRDSEFFANGFVPAAAFLLAAFFMMPLYFRVPTWRGEPPFPTGITAAGSPWIGATDPALTVEEWVDYSCPHCKAASERTLRALAERGSKVRVVRRNDPRMTCSAVSPMSCLPLRAALCAAQQGRFWQMDRWLFANATRGKVDLDAAAKDIRLDSTKLKACVASRETIVAANVEYRAAVDAQVIETPSYRIDARKVSEKDVIVRIKAAK